MHMHVPALAIAYAYTRYWCTYMHHNRYIQGRIDVSACVCVCVYVHPDSKQRVSEDSYSVGGQCTAITHCPMKTVMVCGDIRRRRPSNVPACTLTASLECKQFLTVTCDHLLFACQEFFARSFHQEPI